MLAVSASYNELVSMNVNANANASYDSFDNNIKHTSTEDGEEKKLSVAAAAVNLAKLCVGTGILALPYATTKGGSLGTPIVIAIIAIWNLYSCNRMIAAKASVKSCHQIPSNLSSTFSRIAFAAGGNVAVYFTDASIVVTLLGVCITYQITFSKLMEDLLQAEGINSVSCTTLSCISFLLLVLPALATKEVSGLTKYSFVGLLALLCSIVVIVVFGVSFYGQDALLKTPTIHQLPLFPQSLDDFATTLGVCAFGFGISSLVFPIEESMERRAEFPAAVLLCLLFVWLVYSVMGVACSLLFIHDPRGISSNILENLPPSALTAQAVRFTMSVVCLLTFPLSFIPPAAIIEFYILQAISRLGLTSVTHFLYESVNTGDTHSGDDTDQTLQPTLALRIANRLFLLTFSTFITARFPCSFGLVVSLLGSFTVSILSFVLPSFIHLKLVSLPLFESGDSAVATSCWRQSSELLGDVLMTFIGSCLCVVATFIVARQIYGGGGHC